MLDHPDQATAEALARLYDLDLEQDPGDLDLYLALAARTGGPVLEIAAGSGRVAVPLAAAGYYVTAVDIDPAMLHRAGKAAAGAGSDAAERIVRSLERWSHGRAVARDPVVPDERED